jgi:hypothetical protein
MRIHFSPRGRSRVRGRKKNPTECLNVYRRDERRDLLRRDLLRRDLLRRDARDARERDERERARTLAYVLGVTRGMPYLAYLLMIFSCSRISLKSMGRMDFKKRCTILRDAAFISSRHGYY